MFLSPWNVVYKPAGYTLNATAGCKCISFGELVNCTGPGVVYTTNVYDQFNDCPVPYDLTCLTNRTCLYRAYNDYLERDIGSLYTFVESSPNVLIRSSFIHTTRHDLRSTIDSALQSTKPL